MKKLIRLFLFSFLFVLFFQSQGMAKTFTVNDNRDLEDANLNGTCAIKEGGTCTLRAAIMEAGNLMTEEHTITLKSGVTYLLTTGLPFDLLGSKTPKIALEADGSAKATIKGKGLILLGSTYTNFVF